MSSRWQRTPAPRGDDYDARWKALEAAGHDPHGEVAFVMRFGPASVLDAGCGTGRVGIELARRGVDVVGVDLDRGMLEAARRKAPQLHWIEADLASLDLASLDLASLDTGSLHVRSRFDVVVMAGNVMIFVEPGTEAQVMVHMAAHLEPEGRVVAGFQLGQALGLDGYDRAAKAAGLALEARYSTWDGDPFGPGDRYAVSVHRGPASS